MTKRPLSCLDSLLLGCTLAACGQPVDATDADDTQQPLGAGHRSSLAGILEERVFDDFDSGASTTTYFVETETGPVPVESLPGEDLDAHVGQRVTLQGEMGEQSFQGTLTGANNTIGRRSTDPVPVERMVVLLVDFNDSNPPFEYPSGFPPVAADTIAGHLNTGFFRDYFRQTFREALRNQVTRVEDWYRLDRNCEDVVLPGHGNIGYVDRDEIQTILEDREVNHTQFENVTVIINCKQWTSWGIASSILFPDGHRVSTSSVISGSRKLHVGLPDGLIPGFALNPEDIPNSDNTFLRHLVHERVHNFGIGHAEGLDCHDNPHLYPCSTVRYGNPFDVMGNGRTGMAINARTLRVMELRPESNFIDVGDEGGEFSLDPLLSAEEEVSLAAFLHTPFTSGPAFMLENRSARGVDSKLSAPGFERPVEGLAIYTTLGHSTTSPVRSPRWGPTYRIIDPKPASLGVDIDPGSFAERVRRDAITVDNPFFDQITGLFVEVRSPGVGTDGRVHFSVGFDPQRRVCYRGQLPEQIREMYVTRSEEPTRTVEPPPVTRMEVRPGDRFEMFAGTRLSASNPALCPRDQIRMEILNPSILDAWQVDPRGGSGPGEGTGIGDGSGDGDSGYFFYRVREDYTYTVNAGFFEAPSLDTVPPGPYVVDVEYENLRTGRTATSQVTLVLVDPSGH